MKALLFAAGLGTRLRPLTNDRPKALVEINGQTLLEITLRKLQAFGFREVIVNVHHFADLVIETIERHDGWGANVTISDERDFLLETGGGLQKAAWFFESDEPFLVHNVDVVHNLDLAALYAYHLDNPALATLAVQQRPTSRYFIFDEMMQLCGWQNIKTGTLRMARPKQGQLWSYSFSGIHVVSPQIFPLMTETGKFSIVEPYLRLAETHPIQGFPINDRFWLDVGKPENLAQAAQFLQG